MSEPYNGLPPFEAGSETSRDAALSMVSAARTQRERVYWIMIWQGPYGTTDDEIEQILTAQSLRLRQSTVSARRRELELNGRVQKTDMRRRTSSGKTAGVYVAIAPETPLAATNGAE